MVAAQRYDITHEIRNILKLHFEDYFQSLNNVKEMARRLQEITTRTKSTARLLLNACQNQPAIPYQTATNIDKRRSRPFDRLWSLHPDCNDKEVLGFSTWAVFLLHFMVHKAHCVLFRPLYRDQSLGADEFIQTK